MGGWGCVQTLPPSSQLENVRRSLQPLLVLGLGEAPGDRLQEGNNYNRNPNECKGPEFHEKWSPSESLGCAPTPKLLFVYQSG